jgi:hypothetical protein
MTRLEEFIQSPLTALVCAFVLGALALSGRFSVTATQILLFAAWFVSIIGMRAQPGLVQFGSALTMASVLLLLGYYFRPEAVPHNFGVLTAKRETLFSWNDQKKATRSIEIGNSGFKFGQFNLLETSKIVVQVVDGVSKISTDIRDESGERVAEIRQNEWSLKPEKTWDRNYNDDSLEIINPKGRVVLQVRVLPNTIQIQGEWWNEYGEGVRLVVPPDGGFQAIRFNSKQIPNDPAIRRLFVYPSELHLEELAR